MNYYRSYQGAVGYRDTYHSGGFVIRTIGLMMGKRIVQPGIESCYLKETKNLGGTEYCTYNTIHI